MDGPALADALAFGMCRGLPQTRTPGRTAAKDGPARTRGGAPAPRPWFAGGMAHRGSPQFTGFRRIAWAMV